MKMHLRRFFHCKFLLEDGLCMSQFFHSIVRLSDSSIEESWKRLSTTKTLSSCERSRILANCGSGDPKSKPLPFCRRFGDLFSQLSAMKTQQSSLTLSSERQAVCFCSSFASESGFAKARAKIVASWRPNTWHAHLLIVPNCTSYLQRYFQCTSVLPVSSSYMHEPLGCSWSMISVLNSFSLFFRFDFPR